ncbi:MAG: hypothetical protein AUJ28_04185 [Parcubacteria group bacterium CG1_02_37_51]|nr:MAG: hypothetical protein AUJ28_04185 [Parcubacteria group bacterium CG1_02_37_51]
MRSYSHFTQEDRIMLSMLINKGFKQVEIAREINKSQSAISRELNRNRIDIGSSYHAGVAKRMYMVRQIKAHYCRKRIVNDKWLEKYIVKHLKLYWSPEQIVGRLRKNYDVVVCHETIYQYIYKQRSDLKSYLRCKKGRYRRRYGTRIREKQREEAKKKRIDQRPNIIEQRIRVGDFEGDTIVGKRSTGSLVTHVDRTSRYVYIDYVIQATANNIKNIAISRFNSIPKQKRHTITYDNGKEFNGYERIAKETKTSIYFAYPYHSWERGTNENTNGLIRQFFPKKSSFKNTTKYKVQYVQRLLNSRPRKCLNYLTPYEIFIKNMHLT